MSDTKESPTASDKPDDSPSDLSTSPTKSMRTTTFPPYVVASIALLILAVAFFLAQNSRTNTKPSEQVLRLQAELADSARSLNRTRSDAGLEPRDVSDIETPERIASRLSRDAQQLADLLRLQLENNQEKERQIIDKNRQLAELMHARQQDAAKVIKSAADQSPQSSEIAALQQQLRSSNEKIAKLEQRPSSEELTLSRARINTLEAELAQLRREMMKDKTSPQEASNDTILSNKALELLQSLRALEGKNDRDLSDAYNRFASEKRATFVREINYQAGVVEIAVADQEALKNVLLAAPDNALFFVAGYTAPEGDVVAPAVNPASEPILSQRTSNLLQFLKSQHKNQQQCQAAIVGSTLRFSATDKQRNHVCEIWQLTP